MDDFWFQLRYARNLSFLSLKEEKRLNELKISIFSWTHQRTEVARNIFQPQNLSHRWIQPTRAWYQVEISILFEKIYEFVEENNFVNQVLKYLMFGSKISTLIIKYVKH